MTTRYPLARTLIVAALLLFGFSAGVSGNQSSTTSSQNMMKMLDQLDMLDALDEQDFNDALDAAYACIDNNDFSCAKSTLAQAEAEIFNAETKARYDEAKQYRTEQLFDFTIQAAVSCAESQNFSCADAKLREANKLSTGAEAKSQLQEARAYREEMYEIAQAEKQQLAMQRRLEQCGNQCPIPREYNQCANGSRSPGSCREPRYEAPSSSGPNTMQIMSQVVQELGQWSQDQLAQQRQQLQQQQELYEQQRRRQEEFKRQQEQHRRDIERQQQRQIAAAEQQQQQLNQMRQQAEAKRQQAEARRQADEERRLAQQERERAREAARQQREQERLARQQAREREKAEREARKQNYLVRLQQGIRMAGKTCPGPTNVIFGVIPKIKPVEVECVGVNYEITCPGSASVQHSGYISQLYGHQSLDTGCFGDTHQVPSNLGCPAKSFKVRVTRATVCGSP